MENQELFKAFFELAKQYGPVMGVALFNLWIYVINPHLKKRKGTYVSYHTMNGEIGAIKKEKKEQDRRIHAVEEKVFAHAESLMQRERKDAAIDVTLQRLENDNSEMKYMMRDFITTQKTTNRLLGENKDAMKELLVFLKGGQKD